MKIKTNLILEQLSYLEDKERHDLLTKMNKIVSESVKSKMVCEKLSVIDIPFQVHGYFLSEGKPKNRYYFAEDLSLSVKNPINQSFPIIFDHSLGKAASIIGMVTNIWYNPIKKAIGYKGHLNQELSALNVKDRTINAVSATIFGKEFYSKEGLSCKNLVFKELSLVDAPIPGISGGADKSNCIYPGV